MSDAVLRCGVSGCDREGTISCAHCDRLVCAEHAVADFTYLPGGQRPYCVDCDAERQRLYQATRFRGARLTLWSGAGAILGSIAAYLAAALVTADSFAHSIGAGAGFMVGLALALFFALRGS